MLLRLLVLSIFMMSTSCLKYKKTYKTGSEEGAAADPYSDDSSSSDSGSESTDDTDSSSSDEEYTDDETSGDDEESTALTGGLLTILESAAKTQAFTAQVNLNGTVMKTKDVVIAGGKAIVTVSGLKITKNGNMKIEVIDASSARQFSVLLANVSVTSERAFKVTLNKCALKEKTGAAKEATCNWSAEQAIQ